MSRHIRFGCVIVDADSYAYLASAHVVLFWLSVSDCDACGRRKAPAYTRDITLV